MALESETIFTVSFHARWLIPAESHSSGGFLVYEIVISVKSHPPGKFLVPELVIPWRNNHSSGGFHVYELVIPDGITILPVDSSSMSW
jgi:hypothetical protein